MVQGRSEQLEHLRQAFEDGDRRWPGLHHLFLQFGSESAFGQSLDDCNLFIEKFPKVVIRPLIRDRIILTCSPSLHDIRASNRLAFGVAIDDPPGSTSALRRFTELALSACRLLFPEKVESFDNAYGHRAYWPDHWLAEIYSLGQESGDPLLHVREHQLEVPKDRRKFHLSPGYAAPMPSGDVVGIGGKSLPWHELMTRLAGIGLGIDVLEPGIFRASVRALDRIIKGDWTVPGGKESSRARPSSKEHGTGGRVSQAAVARNAWERLVIRKSKKGGDDVVELDSNEFRLCGGGAAELLEILQSEKGAYVKAASMESRVGRVSRVYDKLPKELKQIVEAPGRGRVGYRML